MNSKIIAFLLTGLSTGERFRILFADGPLEGKYHEFDEFRIWTENVSSPLRRLLCWFHLVEPIIKAHREEQHPPHRLAVPSLNPSNPRTKVMYNKIEVGTVPSFDQIIYRLDMEDGVYRLETENEVVF